MALAFHERADTLKPIVVLQTAAIVEA